MYSQSSYDRPIVSAIIVSTTYVDWLRLFIFLPSGLRWYISYTCCLLATFAFVVGRPFVVFPARFVIYMRVRCMWKHPKKEKRERTRPAATCCGQPHTSTGRENGKKDEGPTGESYLLQIGWVKLGSQLLLPKLALKALHARWVQLKFGKII